MRYVDLVTTDSEDILSQTVVDSVVDQLEKKLSSITCPLHKQYPQIVLAGTVTDLKIEKLGCCQPFVDSAWQIITASETK